MLSGRRFFQLASCLLFAAFCFGLVRLFTLRYDTGDVFPPYSSLRSDPLGTAIFYESLRALPNHEVSRNDRNFAHLPPGRDTTLFLAGSHSLA